MEREEKREGGNTCYMLQSGCYLWTGRWVSRHKKIIKNQNKRKKERKRISDTFVFRHRTFHTESYILHRREGGGRGKAKTERRWEEKWKRRSKHENSVECNQRPVENKSEENGKESEIPGQVVLEERLGGSYRKPFRDSNLGNLERERGQESRDVGQRKCRQSSTRKPPNSTARPSTSSSTGNPPPTSPDPPPLAPPRSNDLSPPPRVPPRPSDDLPQRRRGGRDEVARRLEEKVVRLEEELREGRKRVEASEEEGRRLRKRLGGKQGEKLEEQGREVANVTLLLLGLTRRLARLEVEGQGVGGGKGEEERKRRKRRLQEQVEEAKQLRNNIARRSLKVFHSFHLLLLLVIFHSSLTQVEVGIREKEGTEGVAEFR